MQYFLGIVPPNEYKEQIIRFQNRWPSNRILDVVEPHVTVKAQGGLNQDMVWMDKIKEVCSSFSPFQLSLSDTASFGNSVVYISVQSDMIFELHRRLVEAVMPSQELIERYFELDSYAPHLTLGQTSWGMNETELEEMKFDSSKALSPYPTFTVTHVRVYKEVEPDKYVP